MPRKTSLEKQAQEPGLAGVAAARKLRQNATLAQQQKDRDAKQRDLELRNAMVQIDMAISAMIRARTSLQVAGGRDGEGLAEVAQSLKNQLAVLHYQVGVAK